MQSHAELGGILVAHETYSLVKEEIEAEELAAITVKGFDHPIRTYRILGNHEDGVGRERAIRRRGPGFKIDVDMKELARGRVEAIEAMEKVLERLKSGD